MTAAPDHRSGEQALELALSWAGKGFPVFPVGISWDAGKGSTVKRPLCPSPGYHLATTDPDKVRALFADAGSRPDEHLGVGLVPGPAGVVVFDLDIKAGSDGIAFADSIGLPSSTYNGSTASGGRHRWFRKRAVEKVSNRVPETWSSKIDVRSDNGYIVAPGTVTPWGSWEAKGNLDELALVPDSIWSQLDTGSSAGASSWRSFRPEHEARLHPSTLATHQLLVERFGVNPALSTFNEQEGREPWLQVCRPGKTSGISASIGRVGAGALLVFSSNWAPFVADKVYSLDDIEALADRVDEGVDVELLAFHDRVGERLEVLRIEQAAKQMLRAEEVARRGQFSQLLSFDDFEDIVVRRATPRWGSGSDVLWAQGESCLFTGGTGAGKSTVVLQVVRALCGGEPIPGVTLAGLEPLGFPVMQAQRVLYLAADRPDQIISMAHKLLAGVDPARFRFLKGTPPVSVIGDPFEFLEWCREALPGVDVIVFDSLKDFIPRLSSDEDAGAYHQTRNTLLTNGIDVLEIHHPKKGQQGVASTDVAHGSGMIVNGAGSHLHIDGSPGAESVILHQLKNPMAQLPPMALHHDREAWITSVTGGGTPRGLIEAAGPDGMTRNALVQLLHGDNASEGARRRVTRQVKDLIEEGLVVEVDGASTGGRPPKVLKWTGLSASGPPKGREKGKVSSLREESYAPKDARSDSPTNETPVPEVVPKVEGSTEEGAPEDVCPKFDGLTADEATTLDPSWEDDFVDGKYRFDEEGRLRWIDPS